MRNSSPVALGQTIANKYQVEGVLGEGGMGIVVSAWHLGLDQRVAIKLLLSHMRQADSSALERFQREARAAARIRSEHVCRVLDTGSLEDGTPFLVMEYLEGSDLCDELLRRGRFEINEAVRYVREACLALSQAHQAGVIHRDLKPANLFLVQRPDGSRMIKVLDFGVSKSISSSGVPHLTLTKTSALVGSPIYMSPEQLNSSRDVDGRTDLWALGTILYELITGRTPFYGESIPQLVNAVLNTEPEPFANLGINAPAGLEQVVQRALAKQRDARFSSAMEFYAALGPFAADQQGSISGVHTPQNMRTPLPTRSMNAVDGNARGHTPLPSNVTPPSSSSRGPSLRPGTPAPVPPEPQRKRLSTPLLIALIIFVAGIAAVLSRRGRDQEVAQPPSASSVPAPPESSGPLAPEPPKPEPAVPAPAEVATREEPADAALVLPAEPSAVEAAPSAERPAESARIKERGHASREPKQTKPQAKPQAEPEQPSTPRSEPREDGLSNFGGRR